MVGRKPTLVLSFLFSLLSQRSAVYLINQVVSARTARLILLSVIPQKSFNDISMVLKSWCISPSPRFLAGMGPR